MIFSWIPTPISLLKSEPPNYRRIRTWVRATWQGRKKRWCLGSSMLHLENDLFWLFWIWLYHETEKLTTILMTSFLSAFFLTCDYFLYEEQLIKYLKSCLASGTDILIYGWSRIGICLCQASVYDALSCLRIKLDLYRRFTSFFSLLLCISSAC